jgi:formate hydrogenlyase subunit 3/multisubunit Na+/H+ antiporter MnhD subunit
MSPLWLPLLTPLLVAALLAVRRLRPLSLRLLPVAPVPSLAVAVWPDLPSADVPWLLLGAQLEADTTARTFLLFGSIVWIAAAATTLRSREIERPARFALFVLLTMAGSLGVCVAADLATFYALFALATFSTYGLIAHDWTVGALRAARVYVAMAVLGEALLVAGFLFGGGAAGGAPGLGEITAGLADDPRRSVIAGLLICGFGVKLGMIGLHYWVPLAYPAAPGPARAAISGVVTNLGVLGLVRLLPPGQTGLVGWGHALIALGVLAAFAGVVLGLLQTRPREGLAYSSVSQLGLVTLGVGIGLAAPAAASQALTAVLFACLAHALAKASLFLGEALTARTGIGYRSRGLVAVGLLFASLSLAGAPFTPGAVAKSALKDAGASVPGGWGEAIEPLLQASAIATTLLMARVLWLARAAATTETFRVSRISLVPWAALVGVLAASPWLVPAIIPLEPPSQASAVMASAWPVLAGLAIAIAGGIVWHTAVRRPAPSIPPGDLVLPIERALGRARRAVDGSASALERARSSATEAASVLLASGHARAASVPRARPSAAWTGALLALLALAGLLVLALALGEGLE